MKNYIKMTALVCFLLAAPVASFAAGQDVGKQINDAIAKGDYKTAQTLVSQNPDLGGTTEVKLLGLANSDIPSNPQGAAQLLTLSSNLSPFIDSANAPDVASDTRKFTQSVLDASNAENGQPGKLTADTTVSLLSSALTIAQSQSVTGQDPKLAPWIQAQLEKYADDNDVLLAQTPSSAGPKTDNSSRFFQPQFVPPPTGNSLTGASQPQFSPPANSGGSQT